MNRVLIANRGEIARRLIRYYRQIDVETVAVFSEPDAEQPWVEEADYAVYLNGATVAETYMNPARVLAAGYDGGCDFIHPGYCFLADRPDFYELAARANMPVMGTPPRTLARVKDRWALRDIARAVGIPLIPASQRISPEEDGLEAAIRMGTPLWVKSAHGDIQLRVEHLDQLVETVQRVRRAVSIITGETSVYLEREVGKMRQVGTFIVGDHHGHYAHVGTSDGSVRVGSSTWLEQMGDEVLGVPLQGALGAASVALAKALDWVGVGRVRWAVTPDDHAYLLKISPRLTTGFSLAERLFGVDLIHTQNRVLMGESLGWEGSATRVDEHGLQLRLVHVDPDGITRSPGILETLSFPEGVEVETGTEAGQACTPDTDPTLAKITVVAPTRQAAIVKAKTALEGVKVEGVSTNREALLAVLGSKPMWKNEVFVGTVSAILQGSHVD